MLKYIFSGRKKVVIFGVLLALALAAPAQPAHANLVIDAVSLPFDALFGILAMIFSMIAWVLGKLLLLTLSMIIIPILGYNDFGNAAIISIGWPLVRDIVNMFVIVVLLAIAIKTMFGITGDEGKFSWQRTLPQLFITVVAINFSRTIGLLIIDAGQVVMMTFVNAIRDIAAGNFIDLFQLQSLFDINVNIAQTVTSSGNGLEVFGLLGTYIAIVVILTLILVQFILLAGVYLYRIIVLWVLLILSPLAFFMGGIKSMFPAAGGVWQEWWKKFTGAVLLGPILTFFLWLGLAVASGGPVAAQSGFEPTAPEGEETTFGLNTEVFDPDALLSIFIGYILIMVGIQAAGSAAQNLGGVAAEAFGKGGVGEQYAQRIARAPFALTHRAGRYAGGKAVAGGKYMASDALRTTKAGQRLTEAGAGMRRRGLEKGGVLGDVTAGLGTMVATTGGALEREAQRPVREAREKAKKELDSMPIEQQIAQYSPALEAGRSGAITFKEQEKIKAFQTRLATDKEFAKRHRDELERQDPENGADLAKDLEQKSKRATILRAEKGEFAGDEDALKKAAKVKRKNLDIVSSLVDEGELSEGEVEKLVNDEDHRISDLNARAAKDPRVRETLANKVVDTYTDQQGNQVTVTALERVRQGRDVAPDVRDAAKQPIEIENLNEASAFAVQDAAEGGTLDVGDIKAGFLKSKNGQNIAEGLIKAKVDLSGLQNVATKSMFEDRARELKKAPDITEQEKYEINAAIASATGNILEIGVNQDGSIQPGRAAEVHQIIESRPSIVLNMTQQIAEAARTQTPNQATEAITASLTEKQIKDLAKKAQDAKAPERKQEFRQMGSAIQNAIAAERNRQGVDTDRLDKLDRTARRIQSVTG